MNSYRHNKQRSKKEYELHQNKFLKEHSEIDTPEYRECKKTLEYCNTIALSVHKILYKQEIEEALKKRRVVVAMKQKTRLIDSMPS